MEVSKMRGKFIRSLAKWAFRILAITVIVAVGLVFADSLHERKCRGVASHKGKSFEFMGERLTFLNTGQETKGEVLEIEVSFRPTAATNILKWQDGHVHPHQEERFKVISGAVRFRVDDREEVLTAGQSISGPPNVYHTWNSADGKEVKILAELRPALNTDAAAAGFVNAGSMEGKNVAASGRRDHE